MILFMLPWALTLSHTAYIHQMISFKIFNSFFLFFLVSIIDGLFLLTFTPLNFEIFLYMLSIRKFSGTLEKFIKRLWSSPLSDLRRHQLVSRSYWLKNHLLFLKKKIMEKQILFIHWTPSLGPGELRDIVKSNLVLHFSPGSLFLRRFMGYMAGETRSPPKKM